MITHQYRIWDKENKAWLTGNIYLAPDGTLWEEGGQDDSSSFLAPDWFIRENFLAHQHQLPISKKVQAEVDAEFQRRQPEWYDIEFATGLKDKQGKMVFEGDIVVSGLTGNVGYILSVGYAFRIKSITGQWGGELRMFENNHLVVMGNIHENSDLLKQETADE